MTNQAANVQVPGIDIQEVYVENVPVEQEATVESEVKVIKIPVPHPEYDGKYEVTPKAEAQVLPTANKLLAEDLVVDKIPYTEVDNSAGGTTVIIG